VNTVVVQKLIIETSLSRLGPMYEKQGRPTLTRTDVYGLIIRECGDGRWVDEMDFLPWTDE